MFGKRALNFRDRLFIFAGSSAAAQISKITTKNNATLFPFNASKYWRFNAGQKSQFGRLWRQFCTSPKSCTSSAITDQLASDRPQSSAPQSDDIIHLLEKVIGQLQAEMDEEGGAIGQQQKLRRHLAQVVEKVQQQQTQLVETVRATATSQQQMSSMFNMLVHSNSTSKQQSLQQSQAQQEEEELAALLISEMLALLMEQPQQPPQQMAPPQLWSGETRMTPWETRSKKKRQRDKLGTGPIVGIRPPQSTPHQFDTSNRPDGQENPNLSRMDENPNMTRWK